MRWIPTHQTIRQPRSGRPAGRPPLGAWRRETPLGRKEISDEQARPTLRPRASGLARISHERRGEELRCCVEHGRKRSDKTGAPSLNPFFGFKGGIRNRVHRDSWYPTLRKQREGW